MTIQSRYSPDGLLSDLGDVLLTNLADNNLLQYDAATGKWENETPLSVGTGSFLRLANENQNVTGGSFDLTTTGTIASGHLTVAGIDPQLRVGRATKYWETSTDSAGGTTFDAVGTVPSFTFLDDVSVAGDILGIGDIVRTGGSSFTTSVKESIDLGIAESTVLQLRKSEASISPFILKFDKSHGVDLDNLANVEAGDFALDISSYSYVAGIFRRTAQIKTEVMVNNSRATNLNFYTTADAGALTKNMVLEADGTLNLQDNDLETTGDGTFSNIVINQVTDDGSDGFMINNPGSTATFTAFVNDSDSGVFNHAGGNMLFKATTNNKGVFFRGTGAGPITLQDQTTGDVRISSFGGITEIGKLASAGGLGCHIISNCMIGANSTPPSTLAVLGDSRFGDGGAANYTNISITGDITQVGTAIITLDQLYLSETTTPTSPVDSVGAIYTKANNELFFQDGAGVEHLVHGDAFSNLWFHDVVADTITIGTANTFVAITSFDIVGEEDDMDNLVGSISTNDFTVGANGAGEYKATFHLSAGSGGGADEFVVAMGQTLATPITITSATTATPIVCTAVGHGIKKGDMVTISNGTGMAAINGDFFLKPVTDDTFTLLSLQGVDVAGVGTYDGSTATVDIIYHGNIVLHRVLAQNQLGTGGANADVQLAVSDKLKLYVANIGGTDNIDFTIVNMEAKRLGD